MNLLTRTQLCPAIYFKPSGRLSKAKLAVMMSLQTIQKALVYGQTQEPAWYVSKTPAQWLLFLERTPFEFFHLGNRWWQVIREDFNFGRGTMARGRPLWHSPPTPSPNPTAPLVICPVWLVMLRIQRAAINAFSSHENNRENRAARFIRALQDFERLSNLSVPFQITLCWNPDKSWLLFAAFNRTRYRPSI